MDGWAKQRPALQSLHACDARMQLAESVLCCVSADCCNIKGEWGRERYDTEGGIQREGEGYSFAVSMCVSTDMTSHDPSTPHHLFLHTHTLLRDIPDRQDGREGCTEWMPLVPCWCGCGRPFVN